MSADNLEAEAADNCCASCGITEVDEIKLKECDDCDLVKYCSDACKEDHRPEHEAKCKERSAELRDEILFKQPESSHDGDCPICCLPIPIDIQKSVLQSCCSKTICKGCSHAHKLRQLQKNIPRTCPFCRHPVPKTDEEANKIRMKRVEANDSAALCKTGFIHYDEGEYDSSFKYWTKAAELGDAIAHYNLSILYSRGHAVGVEKDEMKQVYHLEEAAIQGHPQARYNLGCHEANNGRFERAVKHFIIAANLGEDGSIQKLKKYYKRGDVSKDDFAAALRAHHAAVNEAKSPQREIAAAWARRQLSKQK